MIAIAIAVAIAIALAIAIATATAILHKSTAFCPQYRRKVSRAVSETDRDCTQPNDLIVPCAR